MAVSGDQKELETLLCSVQDMVFNLSLWMLGTIPDAEDATQEIRLSTWVFRIAAKHLQSYRKGRSRGRVPASGASPAIAGRRH